jgi:GNAT superfamily N-acetyltransferase
MALEFRFADAEDCQLLGALNAQLIRDEGHQNPMTELQLGDRMRDFLSSDYRAVIFEAAGESAGYALFRREPAFIYLRHFFVCRHLRRLGIGREALAWLWENAWPHAGRVRLDVLVGNAPAIAFWKAVGLREYCLTMEADRLSVRQ